MNLAQFKKRSGLSYKKIGDLVGFTDHTRVAKHLSGRLVLSAADALAYVRASEGKITIEEITREGETNATKFARSRRQVSERKRMERADDKPGRSRAHRGKRAGGKAAR